MGSLFFDLLHVDLQIDILHSWFDANDYMQGLIRVLSALDIACSKVDRDACLHLINQLPPFGETAFFECRNQHGVNFIRWLSSRSVPLRSLRLTSQLLAGRSADFASTLPHVEAMFWSALRSVPDEWFEPILRSCPNLTTVGCSANSLPMAVNVAGPQLRALRVTTRENLGEQLSHLAQCSQLQALDVLAAMDTMQVVQACNHLKEIHFSAFVENAVLFQIIAIPQIMRLTAPVAKVDCLTALAIIESRPDLELLHVQALHFSAAGILPSLFGCKRDPAQLLNYRPESGFLKIQGKYLSEVVVEKIAEQLSGRFKSLTIHGGALEALEIAVRRCAPLLTHLNVRCPDFSDRLLRTIAQSCANLESLELYGSVSDVGLEAIFRGCPGISVVAVNRAEELTKETLHAIIAHRLHLKKLIMRGCSQIQEADVKRFREECKRQRWLPVPEVVIIHNRN